MVTGFAEGVTGVTDLVIPSQIYDAAADTTYTVVGIDNTCFRDNKQLTSVTVPEGVYELGAGTFSGCTSLKSVTLPKRVTTLGDRAFENCTTLHSISLPGVNTFGKYAFSNCTSLQSIDFSEDLKIINEYAFEGCTSLRSIDLPDNKNVKKLGIGAGAFKDCSSLNTVTLPSNLSAIGFEAFSGCNGLTRVYLNSNLRWYDPYRYGRGTSFFEENTLDYGRLYVGSDLPEITEYSYPWCDFANIMVAGEKEPVDFRINTDGSKTCTITGLSETGKSIENLVIPTSYIDPATGAFYVVTDIDESAFSGCLNLKSVTISDKVRLSRINDGSFKNCRNLNSISLFSREIREIGNNAFDGCSALTDIEFPDKLGEIGEYAFRGCAALTEISIPSKVGFIKAGAFEGCTSLKSASFGTWNVEAMFMEPSDLSAIGNDAFRGCALTEIKIPTYVTNIGSSAFYGCPLTSISLPKVNCELGDNFISSSTLREISYITYTDKLAEVELELSEEVYNNAILYISFTCKESQSTVSPWNKFKNVVVDGDSGIDSIQSDLGTDTSVEVFTLSGNKVATSLKDLPAGIYIVRSGSKVIKVRI